MYFITSNRKYGLLRLKYMLFTLMLAMTGVFAEPGSGSTSAFTLTAAPTFNLPLTDGSFSTNENFAVAFGGALGLEYELTSNFPLALRLAGAYSSGGLLPVEDVPVPGTLNELTVMGGAGTSLSLLPVLKLRGFVDGGLALGSLSSGDLVPYASARAGTGLDFKINDFLTARLDATWTYMFGLYSGLGTTLGITYAIPAARIDNTRTLELGKVDVQNIFPIFRSYYDDNPVGTVRISNTGKKAVSGIKVSFNIKQYMDAAKECAIIDRIDAGQSIDIPLFGLFNDGILAVTEATKVSAELIVEDSAGNTMARTSTVLVYDRNALTWSDDRHAAAFVSSKDPWVLDLSGNILAATRDSRNLEISANLQTGVAFHEGLRTYGISYMLSPNRPFAQAVVDTAAVDSLKFPRQTLGYRAGDCADLSVLYASFFEAAAIETAFVTVPGHIFMAFDSGLTLDQISAKSMDDREFIMFDGKAWIPVETTMRSAGFLEVWRKAAAEWRDASAKGLAGFHPLHEAWKEFPPVGLPADGSTVSSPPQASIKTAFDAELAKIISMELKSRLAQLGPQPATNAAKFLNNRGILYARYGQYAEAEKDLKAAVKEKYTPAIINLGNLSYVRSDYPTAYSYYTQAAKLEPENPRLLINIATVAAAMGKTDEVLATLDRVRKLDPKTADKYASLAQTSSTGTRAADLGTAEVIWF